MSLEIIYQSEPLEDCLKTTVGLHERVYYNICNGTSHIIPNGVYDHAVFIGVVAVIAAVACLGAAFAWNAWLD